MFVWHQWLGSKGRESLGSMPTSYMWCSGSAARGLSMVERCRSIMDPELISGTASAWACVLRQALLGRYPSHSEPAHSAPVCGLSPVQRCRSTMDPDVISGADSA